MKIWDRFWSKVDSAGECWIWIGAKGKGGYGNFWTGQGYANAHKFLYTQVYGPVQNGLQLDHLCKNTLCVRPLHLEVVPPKLNCQRGKGSRTHCPQGHEYNQQNTYVEVTKRGHEQRHCRECGRVRAAARRLSHG